MIKLEKTISAMDMPCNFFNAKNETIMIITCR